MFLHRNIEARSCKYCCSGTAGSISYCECVFVALGIQHAMPMPHIVICGLPPLYNIFFHIMSQTARFLNKKRSININICLLSFSTNLSATFPILRRTERSMITNFMFMGPYIILTLILLTWSIG